MRIAVCCIAKDENQYFDEWISHYKSIGIDDIIIYDNNSKKELELNNTTVIKWVDDKYGSQSRAYLHCCKKYNNFDYILFVDVDEFYMSKTMSIKKDIEDLQKKYGDFSGIGIYWRIYGNTPPFVIRQPVTKYTKWYGDKHIKSIVNPKTVVNFPDPHKANLTGKYINELGEKVVSPIGEHTSTNMYIKHIFTRSKEEFLEKIERGDANTRIKNRTWGDFYNYNNLCIKSD